MSGNVLGTLAGVLIGGGLTIVAYLVQARYQDFLLRKAIAGSLAGEIEGVMRAVERRNYLADIDNLIRQQQEILQMVQQLQPTGQQAQPGEPVRVSLPTFGVRVTFNYFAVFDKTCDKIGLLGDISGEVALLYTLAKGIVEDMNSLREGVQFPSVEAVVEYHQELRGIMAEQLDRGRQLIQRLRQMQNKKFRLFG